MLTNIEKEMIIKPVLELVTKLQEELAQLKAEVEDLKHPKAQKTQKAA